ncbi:hypothetical protein XENOCAPTIV_012275, partial [Xenoophorus captivus]
NLLSLVKYMPFYRSQTCDAAPDALAGDFVASSAAPSVKSAPCFPAHADTPEKKIFEEKFNKMGERDDTLPPEYRPTEEELKMSMNDQTALDLLSGDLSAVPQPPAPVDTATTKLEPPVLDSKPLKGKL